MQFNENNFKESRNDYFNSSFSLLESFDHNEVDWKSFQAFLQESNPAQTNESILSNDQMNVQEIYLNSQTQQDLNYQCFQSVYNIDQSYYQEPRINSKNNNWNQNNFDYQQQHLMSLQDNEDDQSQYKLQQEVSNKRTELNMYQESDINETNRQHQEILPNQQVEQNCQQTQVTRQKRNRSKRPGSECKRKIQKKMKKNDQQIESNQQEQPNKIENAQKDHLGNQQDKKVKRHSNYKIQEIKSSVKVQQNSTNITSDQRNQQVQNINKKKTSTEYVHNKIQEKGQSFLFQSSIHNNESSGILHYYVFIIQYLCSSQIF